jgi:hypothetical protein
MAEEHQRCMDRMKAESDKMLEEASKVRQEYAQAFLLEEPPTIKKIEESQAHLYYDSLSEQLEFRTLRLQNDYESEKKKRVRKEEDLKDAEDRIRKLQEDLKRLEGIMPSNLLRSSCNFLIRSSASFKSRTIPPRCYRARRSKLSKSKPTRRPL